jgi:hypothetical protein
VLLFAYGFPADNSVSNWLIFGVGTLLECMLLLRAMRARVLGKYFFFYAYVASALLTSLIGIAIHLSIPATYHKWYWPLQLVGLVTGYGILLEILNHVLAPYTGAEKFARVTGVGAFAAIFGFALIAPRILPQWSPGTMIEFERDLRCVQAVFICGLLAVMSYYAIPIGKNMKGMMLGYGLYILTSLVSLAVRAYAGASFNRVWYLVQPLSFDVSLAIWLWGLWSYYPNPAPDPGIRLEGDYEALVARVRGGLGNLWSYLVRTTHD